MLITQIHRLRHLLPRTILVHLLLHLRVVRTLRLLHRAVILLRLHPATEHLHRLPVTSPVIQEHLRLHLADREQVHLLLHPVAAVATTAHLHLLPAVETAEHRHLHLLRKTGSRIFRTEPTESATAMAKTIGAAAIGTSVTLRAGNSFRGD